MSDEIGPAHFILNKAVKSVKIEEKLVTVTVADGQKLEADDVIVAVPVSTWKAIEFDPPLPADLTPQMGLNTKFHVAVKTRFWEQDNLSPRSLGEGPTSITWEDTGNLPEEGGVCLTVFAGGPTARQAIDWGAAQRDASYLAALERIYPKVREQFVKSRFTTWHEDPYTLGSYSFPAPGQVTTLGPRLVDGLGRLHFAGEHCCYAFIGYMEGALQSGVRLAKKLAKRDGLIK
jgi:monoamine oxidase